LRRFCEGVRIMTLAVYFLIVRMWFNVMDLEVY